MFKSNCNEIKKMTLTEYELADLALTAQGNATPITALFVTIMSGYLIVAWLVGEKLTRTQVIFINALFILFQFNLILGWSATWARSYKLGTTLISIDPTFYSLGVNTTATLILFAVTMVFSIPGCINFMWNVRHPKKE